MKCLLEKIWFRLPRSMWTFLPHQTWLHRSTISKRLPNLNLGFQVLLSRDNLSIKVQPPMQTICLPRWQVWQKWANMDWGEKLEVTVIQATKIKLMLGLKWLLYLRKEKIAKWEFHKIWHLKGIRVSWGELFKIRDRKRDFET